MATGRRSPYSRAISAAASVHRPLTTRRAEEATQARRPSPTIRISALMPAPAAHVVAMKAPTPDSEMPVDVWGVGSPVALDRRMTLASEDAAVGAISRGLGMASNGTCHDGITA